MEQYTLNNISADELLGKRLAIGDKYFDNYVAPYYSLLQEYMTVEPDDNGIFKSVGDMDTFYGLLEATYKFICADLVYLLTNVHKSAYNRENNLKAMDGSLANLINMLLQTRTMLEPATKLFLEDLYDLLYRNRRVSVAQHGYILSKPIKAYRIGTKGIEIRLDRVDGSYLKRDDLKYFKPWDDIARLLDVIGIRETVGVLHTLIAVWVNAYFYGNTGVLDQNLKVLMTWKPMPVGIGFIGYKMNGGSTGGAILTPPSGGSSGGSSGGGSSGGSGGTPTITTSVIIPFAATPVAP